MNILHLKLRFTFSVFGSSHSHSSGERVIFSEKSFEENSKPNVNRKKNIVIQSIDCYIHHRQNEPSKNHTIFRNKIQIQFYIWNASSKANETDRIVDILNIINSFLLLCVNNNNNSQKVENPTKMRAKCKQYYTNVNNVFQQSNHIQHSAQHPIFYLFLRCAQKWSEAQKMWWEMKGIGLGKWAPLLEEKPKRGQQIQ